MKKLGDLYQRLVSRMVYRSLYHDLESNTTGKEKKLYWYLRWNEWMSLHFQGLRKIVAYQKKYLFISANLQILKQQNISQIRKMRWNKTERLLNLFQPQYHKCEKDWFVIVSCEKKEEKKSFSKKYSTLPFVRSYFPPS